MTHVEFTIEWWGIAKALGWTLAGVLMTVGALAYGFRNVRFFR